MAYGTEIDVWSFGCIIAELFIGEPLFPGEDENELVLLIMELLGKPSKELIKVILSIKRGKEKKKERVSMRL